MAKAIVTNVVSKWNGHEGEIICPGLAEGEVWIRFICGKGAFFNRDEYQSDETVDSPSEPVKAVTIKSTPSGRPGERTENICRCGCEGVIPPTGKRGRPASYLTGHKP